MYRLSVILFSFALCIGIFAQKDDIPSHQSEWENRRMNFIQKTDSCLIEFQKNMSPVDSNYIVRPSGKWTFKVRHNLGGTRIKSKGYSSGQYFTTNIQTDIRQTLSLSTTYRGITLGMALNPARLTGKKQDWELNINSYGNKYGLDYVYQTSSTFHGNLKTPTEMIQIGNDVVKFRGVTTTAYYVFNGHKFSLPAAFTQSYIQKRSAGSFFLGASYHGSSLMINNPQPEGKDLSRIRTNHAGISIGYGYNLVPSPRWIAHLSLQPSVVFFSYNRLYHYDGTKSRSNEWSDILFTGRLAVIHYFGKSCFGGLTYTYNHSKTGDSDQLSVSNGHWRGRLLLGMRI